MKQLFLSLLAVLPLTAIGQTTAPTMGWSSWNTYRVKISDKLIEHQADCMVSSGLKAAGYTFVNIDDGFQGGRDDNGCLKINPHRFPNGLKPVVDYIHSKGLKAGIYSDAGRSTCGSYYDKDTLSYNVGFFEHDQQDATLYFKDLGFDFIKVDFCGGNAGQNRDSLALDEQERYTAIRRAIDATGRKDVRMNVCRWNYPGTWVSGVADSWRTTHDIRDSWRSVKGILKENLYLSAYASDGHYNDMDMLEVGRSMTLEEDMTHFGMWCMMESPLLIGCDLGTIKPQTLDLLKNPELIALHQAQPHQQAYLVGKSDGCYILVKDVDTVHGLKRAVAFYNPEDREAVATLSFRNIDLSGTISVRSVFMQREVGTFSDGKMSVTVPQHGCRIYVLTGENRLDRKRYEAETAYIPAYQELWNNQARKTGIYEYDDQCSTGLKASWLGCSAENSLIWRQVNVARGGRYTLAVAYRSADSRQFTVSVNGQPVKTLTVSGNGTAEIEVTLQSGDNEVRLSNDTHWMPDMDYIELSR
ncbi:MAG: alpha-galactosidase [Prevotella sp.]|nr:alpha-galactosidase [Prevotella sp.]